VLYTSSAGRISYYLQKTICFYNVVLYFYIFLYILYFHIFVRFWGPGRLVGMAIGYGLDSPGIESRWGRDFPHMSRQTLGPTQPTVQWSFLEVESGRGVTLTPHPLLVLRYKNRVELYLYSPEGPSWPMKRVKPNLT
jgi:hypothetical protein